MKHETDYYEKKQNRASEDALCLAVAGVFVGCGMALAYLLLRITQ